MGLENAADAGVKEAKNALRVTFIGADGVESTIEITKPGLNLMEVAKANGIAGIYGDCGGGCSCATCHVYIDPKWQAVVGPPDEIETTTLDLVNEVRQSNSRLACQIKLRPELDGLTVTVAPEAF